MGFRDFFGKEPPAADESTISVPDALGMLAKGGAIIDIRSRTSTNAVTSPGRG